MLWNDSNHPFRLGTLTPRHPHPTGGRVEAGFTCWRLHRNNEARPDPGHSDRKAMHFFSELLKSNCRVQSSQTPQRSHAMPSLMFCNLAPRKKPQTGIKKAAGLCILTMLSSARSPSLFSPFFLLIHCICQAPSNNFSPRNRRAPFYQSVALHTPGGSKGQNSPCLPSVTNCSFECP